MRYDSALVVKADLLPALVAALVRDKKLEAEIATLDFKLPTVSVWLGGASPLAAPLLNPRGGMSKTLKQTFEKLSAKLDGALIVHQGNDDGIDGVARFEAGRFIGAARVDMTGWVTPELACVLFRGAKRRSGSEELADEADAYLPQLLAEWAPLEGRSGPRKKLPISLAQRVEDSVGVTWNLFDPVVEIGKIKAGQVSWSKLRGKDAKEARGVLEAAKLS